MDVPSLTDERSRAQSESLATILMVAIVVTTVGIASAAVLERSQSESEVTADLAAEVTADSLSVSHRGGDSLAFDSLRVVVENETGRWRYSPATAGVVVGDTDDAFDPGERWELPSVPYRSGDVVSVTVYDTARNSRLRTDRQVARESGGGGSTPTATTSTSTTTSTTATTTTTSTTATTTTTPTTTTTTPTTTTTTPTTTPTPGDTERPTIESFVIVSNASESNPAGSKANVTVSWTVSDNGEVSNVTVELRQNGATLDRISTEPDTASASGSAVLVEDGPPSGDDEYEITLTVTDAAGNSRDGTLNYSVSDSSGGGPPGGGPGPPGGGPGPPPGTGPREIPAGGPRTGPDPGFG